MRGDSLYEETVSSIWTEALFVGLTMLFFTLLIWRIGAGHQDFISAALLLAAIFFLFYSLNYRTLQIRLSSESLQLKFGIFKWAIPLDNVAECRRDDLPILMRYGGAGIHFMLIRWRYRVSFNFLEHPRVVIALKRKARLVQDVSFSTRDPDEILQLLLQNAPMSPGAA